VKWLEEEEREEKDWRLADERCRSVIKSCVTDTYINSIDKCVSAYEMWVKLKEDNKGSKLMHAMTLKKQLFRIQQGSEETLMKLLERV
jgi:hypothetical protein